MSLALILSKGDPLERHMFSDEEFSRWFDAYAIVWGNHLLPQRGADGYANPAWREFAQRNYTAVVRCWNARTLRQKIKAASASNSNAGPLLDLHCDLAGFFAMSRAAMENLHWAFVDRKIKTEKDWKYVDAFGARYPNIGWLRHIRNDLLHNRLLPIDGEHTPVTIDRSLLPTDDVDTDKAWHHGTGMTTPLVTVIDDVWNVFPQQMNSLWRILDTALSAEITGSQCGMGAGSSTPMGHGSGVRGEVVGDSGTATGMSGSPGTPPVSTKQ